MNSTLPSLDDDLEYVLFKNELEEQRREKEQSSKLFSLRSVIIILSLFSSIALITVLTLLATSATVPEIAPLAAYDIKSDTFSPRTFPNIEQLMEEKPASQKELSAEVKNRILSKMDTKVKPCDDFYSHVCGAWEKEYTLLSGEHSHTDSFDSIMRRTVQQQFHTLFSKFDFISPFYKSCMNPDDVDASGDAQLAPIMALIDSVQDADSFFDVLGQLHRGNFASDVLFQTELFPLNADQIPGIDAVERTYSVLVQPVISRVSSHYSSLPKLLKVMNLADDKHAKSLASEITRVVSDITKIMSKSEDGEEVANCAPTTLMEDESVGNFGRMFIMYNKGMGNGSLYNQKARSHLMTSRYITDKRSHTCMLSACTCHISHVPLSIHRTNHARTHIHSIHPHIYTDIATGSEVTSWAVNLPTTSTAK